MSFKHGYAEVVNFEELNDESRASWGLIDKYGNVVVPLRYDEVSYCPKGRIAIVRQSDKYGFIPL
jgi:hypothetical protein